MQVLEGVQVSLFCWLKVEVDVEPEQYDLFEIMHGDRPRWIGAAANLEHARRRVKELADAAPGILCFVREFRSGTVVAVASGIRVSKRHLAATR